MEIRNATSADTRRLLEIYAPYVERTAITFEYDVPTLEDFANRIETIGRKYPYLVAEEGGKIVGYAYAHQFQERAAYQWSVESSIYLDTNDRHHGIGRALYGELERRLRAMGILNMNACITYMDEPDDHLYNAIIFSSNLGRMII